MKLLRLAVALTLSFAMLSPALRPAPSQDAKLTTFGVTVVNMAALRGEVYLIPETDRLPRFEKLKPVGTIYATELNIPARQFQEGFPGITDRFEWFAIDYTGRFWIEKPGLYEFSLTSDDGAKLYIDGRVVVDNDGLHSPKTVIDGVNLSGGVHHIRVSYFQGPRLDLALVLSVAGPGEERRIFSTKEFRPRSNPENQ